MNELTPGRMKGTLLERAAARYDLTPPPLPTAPQQEPVAAPRAEPAPPPRARGPLAHIDLDALTEEGMIVPGASVTSLAEEFRLVKRQLLQTARAIARDDEDKARAMLVCSANPGDGKTFCAINLAMSLAAEREVEILLVDADVAKPDVMKRLGLPSDGPGLLDALEDNRLNVEDFVLQTDVPQLSLLPAGTKSNSDTELLASDHARRVLGSLVRADPNRIVIFDSPPALAASPAAVLAGLVGQTMLVVRADRTSEGDLRKTVALLDACEHLQLVLNSASFQATGRRFGSYYQKEGEA